MKDFKDLCLIAACQKERLHVIHLALIEQLFCSSLSVMSITFR